MERVLDHERLERLLEAGRGLLADLDLGLILDRLLELARELTGARYAALGILDERRTELAQFLTVGVDEGTQRAIGELPRGRGILGILIEEPAPLRLHDVGAHPRSYGFPPGHPDMRMFLGVPILIRGEAWGNLYLTEKAGGEDFDEADEASVVVLADWAALAIEHARLYEAVSARRTELERAVRGFEATAAIARAVGGETDLDRVLELIVKRGRALVEARSVLILLREGDELWVAAGAGHVGDRAPVRVPIAGTPAGDALEGRGTLLVGDVERHLRLGPGQLGVPDASAALLVPLVFRGRPLGLLMAFDRMSGAGSFTREDEHLLQAFAASAATAVANAQAVEAERLRHSLRAAEEERRRWARELHDETLQGLGGLRVLLRAAARQTDAEHMRAALTEVADHVTREIDSLRAIITDLRPAALDELGLGPALDSLLQRTASAQDLDVRSSVALPERRLSPELETVVYRVIQEALTNVAKHARASSVAVEVDVAGDLLRIRVADDGVGLAPGTPTDGFGLVGMHERIALAGGDLEVARREPGTVVRASVPLAYADDGNVTRPA
jgi:signal transduction histidine kinase